jgi:phosphoribosylcarboxyaminoimidazole (NCAIR) mutase
MKENRQVEKPNQIKLPKELESKFRQRTRNKNPRTHLVPSAKRTWILFVDCVMSTSKRGLMLALLAGAGGAALAEDVLGALTGARRTA